MLKVYAESVTKAQVTNEQDRLRNLGIENVPNRTVRSVVRNRRRRIGANNPRR